MLGFAGYYNQSSITSKQGKDILNDYRISEDYRTIDPELKSFLQKKLLPDGIKSIPTIEFIKYKKGSKFMLHRDRNVSTGNSPYRVKTLIIQLSSKGNYKGGELVVEGKTMPQEKGSLIIFDSSCLHEVKELKDGERFSLCLFLKKENLVLNLL